MTSRHLLKSFVLTHFPTPPSCLGQHMFVAWASMMWRYEDKWMEISCEINLDLLFLLQIRLFDLRLWNLLKLKSSLRTLICCFRSKKVLGQEKNVGCDSEKKTLASAIPTLIGSLSQDGLKVGLFAIRRSLKHCCHCCHCCHYCHCCTMAYVKKSVYRWC